MLAVESRKRSVCCRGCRACAAAARELADAASASDLDKLGAAQEHLDAATSRESPIVAAVNELCQAP